MRKKRGEKGIEEVRGGERERGRGEKDENRIRVEKRVPFQLGKESSACTHPSKNDEGVYGSESISKKKHRSPSSSSLLFSFPSILYIEGYNNELPSITQGMPHDINFVNGSVVLFTCTCNIFITQKIHEIKERCSAFSTIARLVNRSRKRVRNN